MLTAAQRRDVAQPDRADLGRPPRPATCCGRTARTAPRTLPAPAPAQRHRDAQPRARRCAPTACAAGCSSWDGQLEDDARLVVTASPAPRRPTAPDVLTRAAVTARDRDRRRAARRAHRRDVRRPRPRRRQRDRRVGRRPRRRASGCGPAAAPTSCCAAGRCRGTRVAVMVPVPGATATASCSPCRSPTAPSTSASPTSRSTARSPTCPTPSEERDRVPARRGQLRASPRR